MQTTFAIDTYINVSHPSIAFNFIYNIWPEFGWFSSYKRQKQFAKLSLKVRLIYRYDYVSISKGVVGILYV